MSHLSVDLPKNPHSQTGQLSLWISNIQTSSIPPEILTRAKYLILDGLACALVGAHLPWSETATNVVLDMEPAGDCPVFGWEKSISPLAAALINSTFIQGFELDDYHSQAPLHSNAIILPALFAMTSHLASKSSTAAPISGSTFLLAYLVGLETGPRVGNALYGKDMLTRGWHSGAVFGPAAAAASVSKLLDLPASRIEDALGIACTQACGLMSAQYESMVKRMQHGFAARNGLFAALLARGGYVGIKNVFDTPYGGFLSQFGQGSRMDPEYLLEEVTKGLGQKWQTDGVRVKLYASMAATHCTVDCIRDLQEKYPERLVDLEGIESVKIEMGRASFHHGGFDIERPLTTTGAQMSATYVAATQFVDRDVLALQFQQDMLERDIIWSLAMKTKCYYCEELGDTFAQRVTITFTDKTTINATRQAPRGHNPPISNDEIVEKWRKLTTGIIDDERRAKIEQVCLNLDDLENVLELTKLMSPIVGSLFDKQPVSLNSITS